MNIRKILRVLLIFGGGYLLLAKLREAKAEEIEPITTAEIGKRLTALEKMVQESKVTVEDKIVEKEVEKEVEKIVEKIVEKEVEPTYKAGNVLLISSDVESYVYGKKYAYTTVKEIRIAGKGTLRIKYDVRSEWAAYKSNIFRNGVAVGTEHISGRTNYETLSEDISGWSPGDLVQVKVAGYQYSPRDYRIYVRNFRLYTDRTIRERAEVVIES